MLEIFVHVKFIPPYSPKPGRPYAGSLRRWEGDRRRHPNVTTNETKVPKGSVNTLPQCHAAPLPLPGLRVEGRQSETLL